MSGEPELHVYGQGVWHDEVFVVGNPAGLTALRDAIDASLRDGAAVTPTVFVAADGEGYQVFVERVAEVDRLATPYSEECARDNRSNVVPPWELEGVKRLLKKRDRTGGAS